MSFETWWETYGYEPGEVCSIKRAAKDGYNSAQAEMRELGPCGKHPKAFYKDVLCNTPECPIKNHPFCTICEEIRLAVKKALAGDTK